MEAIEFPEQTVVLAKDQPQYLPLPVHYDQAAEGTPMTCCFKLSSGELEEINRTGMIWHRQLTFGQPLQPIMLLTKNPFGGSGTEQPVRAIKEIKEINRAVPEGKLLFAAIAKITSESQTDKTPDQVIDQLYVLVDHMEG